MGTMPTFNAKDWQPVTLVSPDGRTYTPGDHTEHRQLLASGYRVAPVDDGRPLPVGNVPIDASTAAPDSTPADDAAAAVLAADATTETPKTKTTRRNGGAQ